jgi:glutaredoxin
MSCILCDQAKRFLKEQGLSYKEVCLETPEDIKLAKSRLPDPEARVMLPLVFYDGKYIGGKDEMIRHATASYR